MRVSAPASCLTSEALPGFFLHLNILSELLVSFRLYRW